VGENVRETGLAETPAEPSEVPTSTEGWDPEAAAGPAAQVETQQEAMEQAKLSVSAEYAKAVHGSACEED
jgi:hypothetical protein